MISSNPSLTYPVRDLLRGAIAGSVATVPMTISMLIGWRLLPGRERYPLPPREITQDLAKRLGIGDRLTDGQLTAATMLSHFGYGAFFGSTYALMEKRVPLRSGAKGVLAGLMLWVASYLGWLPALGILKPATRHPWRRNVLMILAHIVWGLTLEETTRKLESNAQYVDL